MSNQPTDTIWTADGIAMALGGLGVLVGVVVWPPLIALGLAILTLYVLYELLTPGSIEGSGSGPTGSG